MQVPASLRDSLHAVPLDANRLAALWRGQTQWLAALPPRYPAALENILQRLESGASFSEESCSFSQRDLLDALGVWLDRVEQLPPGS